MLYLFLLDFDEIRLVHFQQLVLDLPIVIVSANVLNHKLQNISVSLCIAYKHQLHSM